MNYLYFKVLKNFPLVSTSLSIATIVGITIFSLPIAQAAQLTFDFKNDTWDHGGTTSTGWTDGETTGTTTNNGLSLTMTSTFVNGATAHSGNLTDLNTASFKGFLMGNKNSSDDIASNNTLNGYQRWDFQFSEPVNLDDVTITDLDSSSSSYIDAVAAEGFTSFTPGDIGTGIAPSFTNIGSELGTSIINLSGGGNLDFVADDISNGYQGTQTNDVNHQAALTFAEPVDSFSVYLFNNLENVSSSGEHGVGIGTEDFQISVNQVPFEFSPGLGLLLSGGGLLGMRFLKQRRQSKKLEI